MELFLDLFLGIVLVIAGTFVLGYLLRLCNIFPDSGDRSHNGVLARESESGDSRGIVGVRRQWKYSEIDHWLASWRSSDEAPLHEAASRHPKAHEELLEYLQSTVELDQSRTSDRGILRVLRRPREGSESTKDLVFVFQVKSYPKDPVKVQVHKYELWPAEERHTAEPQTYEYEAESGREERGIAAASKRWYLHPDMEPKSVN